MKEGSFFDFPLEPGLSEINGFSRRRDNGLHIAVTFLVSLDLLRNYQTTEQLLELTAL